MKPRTLRSILTLLLIIVLLSFALRPFFEETETAEVTLPEAPGVGDSLHNTNELGQGQYTAAEVKPETVQVVVEKTLIRAENYSRNVTVERFWADGSSTETLECHIREDAAHIISSGIGDTKHTLILPDELYIWYAGSSREFTGIPSSATGYGNVTDEFTGILTYEELLALDVSRISEAGYTIYGGESCIWAKYTVGQLGYTNTVYISTATGLLMGAEKYDGESLIYRMSSEAPVIEMPADSWFELPS